MEDLVNQYVWDIVQDKTDQAIDTLFEEVHGEVGTRSGDINPDQVLRLSKAKEDLKQIIYSQVAQNL